MKSSFLKYSIISLLFLLIIILAAVFVQPLYKQLTSKFDIFAEYILKTVSDSLGVDITYEKLSPSVFSSIEIEGVKLKNKDTGQILAELEKASIKYNILSLLKGDFVNAVKEVVFRGGKVEFQKQSDMPLVFRIRDYFKEKKDSVSSSKTDEIDSDQNIISIPGEEKVIEIKDSSDIEELIKKTQKLLEGLPFVISLRDFIIHYRDYNIDAKYKLNSVSLVPEHQSKLSRLVVDSNLDIELINENRPKFFRENNKLFSCSIDVQGTCASDLTEALAVITFDDVKVATYSISKFSFLAVLDDRTVSVNMVQNLLPYNIEGKWSLISGEIEARFDAEKLDLYDLMVAQVYSIGLRRFSKSTIDGSYKLWFNTKNKTLNYDVAGEIFLTEKLIDGGAKAEFNFTGTQETLNLSKFRLDSKLASFALQCSCIFQGLRIDGFADVRSILLPNGKTFATSVYLKPLSNGTEAIIPRLMLGEQQFRDFNLSFIPMQDSINFIISAFDAKREKGKLLVDGLYSLKKPSILEIRADVESMSLGSIARTAAFFVKPKAQKNLKKWAVTLSPYSISSEIFFSTDFKSYTLNAPRVGIIHTGGKRQMFFCSITGSEMLFSINNIIAGWSGQHLQGNIQVDVGQDFSDIIFSSDLNFNDIPYSIGGTFVPDSYVSVIGDYGLEVAIDLAGSEKLGTVVFENFPLKVSDKMVSASAQASLSYESEQNWQFHVSRLNFKDISGILSGKPSIDLSFVANPGSVLLESFLYSDSAGTLSGFGSLSWLYEDSILDAMAMHIQVNNPFSNEQISLNGTAANPERIILTEADWKKDYYFIFEGSVQEFAFARIMNRQHSTDTFTASLTASGTFEEPLATLSIDQAKCSIKGYPFEAKGSFILADGTATAEGVNIKFRDQELTNVMLDFKPKTFNGKFTADYLGTLFAASESFHSFKIPLAISLNSKKTPGDSFVPEDFSVTLSIAGVTGDLINIKDTYTYVFSKKKQRMELSGGIKNEAQGFYELDTGKANFTLSSPSPIKVNVSGEILSKENKINLSVKGLQADLYKIKGILTYPFFKVETGLLVGYGSITGMISDPDFNGEVTLIQFEAGVPKFLENTFYLDHTPIKIEHSSFRVDPMIITIGKGDILFDAFAYFDRWKFDTLSMNAKTLQKTQLDGKINLDWVNINGKVSGQMLIEMTHDDVFMSGDVLLEKGSAEITLGTKSKSTPKPKSRMEQKVQLNIEIGEKTEVVYPNRKSPVFWAQVVPHTKFVVAVDSAMNTFEFKGNLKLRGGEIMYVGRNFYLKEGNLVFDANENSIDPFVTLKAEIRERDTDGKQVKIILSAENQLLSQLSPSLSATPAKSEAEIMALLGQALLADSTDSDAPMAQIAISLMDYGMQVAFFRHVERQLRNILKFDIFSFRTTVVQNTMLQMFNLNKGRQISIGNFLDNSTVYVGKYFGDAIYADAMLQVVYDEAKLDRNKLFSGLHLQPEIGFEMNSPYATIRWSISPDIADKSFFRNLLVPSTSLTISKKWQF
ncbi:MAG: hypothetical protein GX297_02205 [Treponema sp.]|nr:hypothetical protein [Treponema sp.]